MVFLGTGGGWSCGLRMANRRGGRGRAPRSGMEKPPGTPDGWVLPLSQGCVNAPALQLSEVLPVLSSFGHAKTVLNANASRFGQVLRLCLRE